MNTSPDPAFRFATLGLGGNIGDPVHAMGVALRALDNRADCRVVAVSRLYRTPPWGKTDQADFYNACAGVETSLSPDDLLDVCLGIEREMKRERIERWGPRTIDIDVLTYGDFELATEKLHVPHPRMTTRGFVLMPLADFAPDLVISGRTVGGWLTSADTTGIAVADEDPEWWRRA
ncbi:2-amino-4-hydroxy-6-hydroxymethyldihydropteridine diphosphokinase [Rhizobiaceae bacterium n13]|uniref:2-amino-4-hydroxy-6-hydroxymethyldihydropteridine pyrophosphokinase n=1 Tax=Ferirhizobium litorale TaxID=2927786 RepID=A0AAE3QFV3_9HYPH|nr:2-amino-4-hydroxy-6-hydroxymethyldihydropteridine diphosphokinase [Fererhizobium litorale]MDI7863897.1 2-amino-4-hydroxy-6-hydroxymethyldihydropteridine diphosphokinase [Fererhizobium litorale]MDI7924271.1 2-amino-4-hydroxy-6-hydroxymethyldihydropteridine diphosphokinase [Fererhizobium litorale]